jgi:hypothetical protein
MHFKMVFLTPAVPHMFNKGQGLVSYHKGEFQEFDVQPANKMVVEHIPAKISARRDEPPPTEVEEIEELEPLQGLLPETAIGKEPDNLILDRARWAFERGATSRRKLANELEITPSRATQLLAVIKNERR